MDSFGARFKKLRKNKGLTQDELVKEFNERYGYSFTKGTISQYEHDKRIPEMNTIKKFVEYFDVSLDYLLCNDILIVKELSSQYGITINNNVIEISEFIDLAKELIKSNTIKKDSEDLLEDEKRTLENCLDIAYELINRKT